METIKAIIIGIIGAELLAYGLTFMAIKFIGYVTKLAILYRILVPFIIIVFYKQGMYCVNEYRKRLGKTLDFTYFLEGKYKSNKGDIIIYLRSFEDDHINSMIRRRVRYPYLHNIVSEEEQIVEVLGKIGWVVSIGDPKDEIPPLGADRLYLSKGGH